MMKKLLTFLLLSIFTLNFTYASDVDADQRQKRKLKGCVTHVVNFGEDLGSIINRYEISVADLQEYNPAIKNGIKIGELIYIPQKRIGSATSEQIKSDLKSLNASSESSKPEPKVDVASVPKSEVKVVEKPKNEFIEHTVKRGETFYSISRSYGVTVTSIHDNNPDISQNDMSIGTVLKIYLNNNEYEAGVDHGKTTLLSPTNNEPQAVEESPVVATAVVVERKAHKFDDVRNAIKVSLLLPLKSSGASSRQFVEFYNGFLVGLDSLKNEGVSVVLNVINTDKSTQDIDKILQSGELDNSDLIIGPVYDEQFCQVAKYAADRAIPIVSPLATVSCNNKYTFQVAPSEESKYDKLKSVLFDKNVILFSSSSDDAEFVAKIKEYSGGNFRSMPFNVKVKPDSYISSLDSKRDNIFIVAAQDEQDADAIISKIGAIRMFGGGKVVRTVASPKVARMSGIDPSNLFSADVSYITSYHVDRTSRVVVDFDRRYLSMFGGVPTLYGYRGYDVAMFFIGSMKEFGSDFYNYISDYYTTVLQVTYRFNQKNPNGMLINREWMYVNYTPTYDVIVK